jgi:hypothetical protein
MRRSASVGCDYEVTEGEARMPHGVASSGTTGSRRRHCLADAPEIGGIVTAPEYSKQKGRNDAWCVLAELSVPSEPGNERIAMERVAEVVKELDLSEQRLERLKTAVAEATMNAIEHGNRRLPRGAGRYRGALFGRGPVGAHPRPGQEPGAGSRYGGAGPGGQARRVADVPRLGSVSDQEHGRRDAHNQRRSPPHCRAGHAPVRRRRCRLNNWRRTCVKSPAWP